MWNRPHVPRINTNPVEMASQAPELEPPDVVEPIIPEASWSVSTPAHTVVLACADNTRCACTHGRTLRALRCKKLLRFVLSAPAVTSLAARTTATKLGLRPSNRVPGTLRTLMPAVSLENQAQPFAASGDPERRLVAGPLSLQEILAAADARFPQLPSADGFDAADDPTSPTGRGTGSARPLLFLPSGPRSRRQGQLATCEMCP